MAITGSDVTVSTATRDSLRTTAVDSSIVGGTIDGPTKKTGYLGFNLENIGAQLAGVTPDMAANIAAGIESYKSRVQGVLDQLKNVDPNMAFRGSAITTALTNFVEGVKTVSNNYLLKLEEAQNEIIKGFLR